jgi:hypothetical protein
MDNIHKLLLVILAMFLFWYFAIQTFENWDSQRIEAINRQSDELARQTVLE